MQTYEPSPELIIHLHASESCEEWNEALNVFLPYPDSGGISTLGWGHKLTHIDIASGIFKYGLSQHGCDLLFLQDLKPVTTFVNSLGICKTQGEFDALVDLGYNAGLGAISMLRKLGLGDANNFFHFIHDRRGVVLNGLVKRRKQDVAWFLGIPLDNVEVPKLV